MSRPGSDAEVRADGRGQRGRRAGDRERNAILGAVVGFAQALRAVGIEVEVARTEVAAQALAAVDPTDRVQVYWALSCTLLSEIDRRDEFDAVFDAFWDAAPLGGGESSPQPQPPAAEDAEQRSDQGSGPDHERRRLVDGEQGGEGEGEAEPEASAGWSAIERLRELDFADYGPEELAAAARLVQRIGRAVPHRRSRRLRAAARGEQPDHRATLRAAIRSEGHPIELAWRERRPVPRRLVFVVDVSGSMEPYARGMLLFLQAALRASGAVEAFAFGTRLTRLTRELAGADPERAIERVMAGVRDWAGGTRIGESLAELNATWGARGLTRGAAVAIVSDGWERGDLDLLRAEMERLHRAAHTLLWVNPLAASEGYQPLVAGMATALPYIDVFLPGHNLRSIEELAAALERLPGRRPGRRPPGAGIPARSPAAAGGSPAAAGGSPAGATRSPAVASGP